MSELPTIKIQHPENAGEWMLINEEDFNPDVHKKFSRTSKKPPDGYKTTTQKDIDQSNRELLSGSSSATSDEDPKAERTNQLEILLENEGWQAIAQIAEPLGIEKPSKGWKDAIPLIVDKEFSE